MTTATKTRRAMRTRDDELTPAQTLILEHFSARHREAYDAAPVLDPLRAAWTLHLLERDSGGDVQAVLRLIDEAFADHWARTIGVELSSVYLWLRERQLAAGGAATELEARSSLALPGTPLLDRVSLIRRARRGAA